METHKIIYFVRRMNKLFYYIVSIAQTGRKRVNLHTTLHTGIPPTYQQIIL